MANHALSEFNITLQSPSSLKQREGNPRTHDRKQMRAIVASIRRFGFNVPILVDDQNVIIAGHARAEAAAEIAMEVIPTICVSHLSQAELKAYVIADNRTAELGGWDKDLLAISLASIGELDCDFDLTVTGFTTDEIELIADAKATRSARQFDRPPPLLEADPVSRIGDLWMIEGGHALLCGDATKTTSYAALIGREKADLVITDPPFNCPIQGHVSGLGEVVHRDFVMASGEMTPQQFRQFLSSAFAAMAASSRSGAVHYIFADWRIIRDVLEIGAGEYTELLNVAVWNKTNAGMGSFLRSQHELIAIFRHGRRRHINNVALGANGRHRTNVWTYAGANSFGRDRDKKLALHPTMKPVSMIADAIMDASHRDGLILDPFGGSGTALLAAHTTGRRARLMELDPRFVDVIIKRAHAEGLSATLAASHESFEQARLRRKAGSDV